MNRRDGMLALANECQFVGSGKTGCNPYRLLRRVADVLRSAQAEPGYVVKPLEWRTSKGDDFCDVHYNSDAIGGSYTIEARKNGSFDLWKPNVQAGRYASLDDAKSAAQSDFEQRIRSAITTVGTAEPGYVAGFEACREALADLISLCERKIYPQPDKPNSDWMRVQAAKAAIAALPAPATASAGWQPIETAPKDGTEIIGIYYRPADGMLKETSYGPWTIAFERGQWRSSWDRSEVVEYMSDFGTEYKEPDCEPTHWMPFPAAPTKRSAT